MTNLARQMCYKVCVKKKRVKTSGKYESTMGDVTSLDVIEVILFIELIRRICHRKELLLFSFFSVKSLSSCSL